MKWQAVFWDFDGVVLDSVDVKTRAFALMFRKYGPEIERTVVEYHLANGGISRFEKFKFFYSNLLHRSVSDEELITLGDQFSSLVYQEVLKAPFIPGAQESLRFLQRGGVPCFVVSGTPQEEISQIVAARGLADYFIEVHGSPKGKQDILRDVVIRYNLNPRACLFLGDAMTDYQAALANGMQFIAVVTANNSNAFPDGTKTTSFINLD